MKFAPLILRNLLRHKRRNVLTLLSIAVSLFVFSALASLPGVAQQILSDRASLRLLCHSKAGILYPLPEAYRARIVGKPHVEMVTAFAFFGGIYRDASDQFPNAAIDPERIDEMWPDWGISAQMAADFSRLRIACLVGSALVRRFHWRVGQQIMLRGALYPINLTLQIVGILGDRAPPPILVFRRDYLEEALGRTGLVNMFWVRVDKQESIAGVIADLDRTFANSDAETQTESEMGFFSGLIAGFRGIFTIARVLGAIVVVTMGLVARQHGRDVDPRAARRGRDHAIDRFQIGADCRLPDRRKPGRSDHRRSDWLRCRRARAAKPRPRLLSARSARDRPQSAGDGDRSEPDRGVAGRRRKRPGSGGGGRAAQYRRGIALRRVSLASIRRRAASR